MGRERWALIHGTGPARAPTPAPTPTPTAAPTPTLPILILLHVQTQVMEEPLAEQDQESASSSDGEDQSEAAMARRTARLAAAGLRDIRLGWITTTEALWPGHDRDVIYGFAFADRNNDGVLFYHDIERPCLHALALTLTPLVGVWEGSTLRSVQRPSWPPSRRPEPRSPARRFSPSPPP